MENIPSAVIFDMDDTLVVEEASAVAAFTETGKMAEEVCGVPAWEIGEAARRCCVEVWHRAPARQYCLDIHMSSREGLWAEFEGDGPDLKIMREWAPNYRREAWHMALSKYGVNNSTLAESLAESFMKTRRNKHIVYPDTFSCLEAVSGAASLALLTNGLPEIQRKKIAGAGIGRYFKEIVISGDIGYGKPDIRIFQLTLSRLGLQPQQTWMVGDNPKRDLQSAKALGIYTVWLNREGKARDESIIPDTEISDLNQLVDLIRTSASYPHQSR